MAYLTHTQSAAPGFGTGLSGFVTRIRGALAQRRVYHATMAELDQLTDRELADLNLSRLMIPSVAHEAAYGH